MPDAMAVQVTIYLTEGDKWQNRPLHMEILNYLREENVYAATAVHAVGGFLGRQRVKTSHLVDAGGKLPLLIIFVDTDEHVNRVLPKLKEMASQRMIVRENVVIEQGNLELTCLLLIRLFPSTSLALPLTVMMLSKLAAELCSKWRKKATAQGFSISLREKWERGAALKIEPRKRRTPRKYYLSPGGKRSTFPTGALKTRGRTGSKLHA